MVGQAPARPTRLAFTQIRKAIPVTIRPRFLTVALLASATTGAVVVPAAEAKVKPATAAKILQDCKKDGTINKPYRLADLKKAKKAYGASKKSKKTYANCNSALTSAIAGLTGKKGTNSTNAVVKECANYGALKKKYKAATLKKALAGLNQDAASYTDCASSIESQLNTITKR